MPVIQGRGGDVLFDVLKKNRFVCPYVLTWTIADARSLSVANFIV